MKFSNYKFCKPSKNHRPYLPAPQGNGIYGQIFIRLSKCSLIFFYCINNFTEFIYEFNSMIIKNNNFIIDIF